MYAQLNITREVACERQRRVAADRRHLELIPLKRWQRKATVRRALPAVR